MAREVKTIKLDNGDILEVYSAACNVCNREMIFPKDKADQFESMLPFLKQKIDAGTPCAECSKKQIQDGTFNLFSEDEKEQISNIFKEVLTKSLEEEKAKQASEKQLIEE